MCTQLTCLVIRYTLSLQALSHALLLAPQNPFYALQFAETAYTAGDIPLALKTFLMVVDMSDGGTLKTSQVYVHT